MMYSTVATLKESILEMGYGRTWLFQLWLEFLNMKLKMYADQRDYGMEMRTTRIRCGDHLQLFASRCKSNLASTL